MRANLATLVDEFRLHSADTAVVAHRGNRAYRTSYGELAMLAGRFSAELDRRGIAPGERVVLWGANSAEWIAAFFGCILRAVIVVPLDAGGTAEFAGRVIRDTAPRLIVGDAHLLASLNPHLRSETLRQAQGKLWGTRPTDFAATDGTERQPAEQVGFLAEGGEDRVPGAEARIDFGHVMPGLKSRPILQPGAPHLVLSALAAALPSEPLFTVSDAIGAHTPFQIVFTSGTTAEPRGIVHTHRNILVSIDPIEREMQKYLRYERIFHPLGFLHMLPLSHVFGQFMGLWCPALLGAEVHFAEEIEPSRIVLLIQRERVSVLIAVPRMLALLRTHLLARFPALAAQIEAAGGIAIRKKWWRFRRVHSALGWKFWAVISGGATLPAELEAFWNRLGFALIQGYGMTETAALVTLNHPFHIKEGSIGRALPGREVQISADGEVLVRGDMLSEATWQGGAMRKREGEWLATGDLAEASASGELKFLGRKGDVIVTSAGLNIHPADLEAALIAQAGIRAAAVVAFELSAGPEPVAVVMTTLTDAELQAAVDAANRTLAEFQQIRRVLRWPELQFPYTTTGKLIRRQMAAWACAELTGNLSEAALTQDSLLAVIAEVTGEPIPIPSQREGRPQGLKPASSVPADVTAEAVPLARRDAVPSTSSSRRDTDAGISVTDASTKATDLNDGEADSLRLSEDMHLDSLGRVQLQSALEQRFSVELDDDAIATVRTVWELRAMMEVAGGPLRAAGSSATDHIAQPGAEPASASSTVQSSSSIAQPATEDHLYPHWPWSAPIRLLRTLWVECFMRPLVWLLAAPRVTFASNLAPSTEQLAPLLIISNHVTAFDGALILYALPAHLRDRVAAAMSGDMLLDYRLRRNQGNAMLNALAPAAYYLLTALFNVFPLPRARGFRRSFAHAGEAMDRGYSVLIFPEGTRSRVGHMNRFRPGIGLLARQSQVPILPVALVGLYDAEPATRCWFHSGQIEIRVGEIISAPTEDADPAALTAQLQQALHALMSAPQKRLPSSASASGK